MDRERTWKKVKGRTIFQTLGQIEISTWPLAVPSSYHPPSNFWPSLWKKKKIMLNTQVYLEKTVLGFKPNGKPLGKYVQKWNSDTWGQYNWVKCRTLLEVVLLCDPKEAFWYFSKKWTWETYHNAPSWMSFYQRLSKHNPGCTRYLLPQTLTVML